MYLHCLNSNVLCNACGGAKVARIQLVLPDADKDRFVHQAQMEGISLSQWLRTAAHDRLERAQSRVPWTAQELQSFFEKCDELDGPEREPDWDEHLRTIERSRLSGVSGS